MSRSGEVREREAYDSFDSIAALLSLPKYTNRVDTPGRAGVAYILSLSGISADECM